MTEVDEAEKDVEIPVAAKRGPTSVAAFGLFFIGLAVGILLLLLPVREWSPAVPVALYGGLLWMLQLRAGAGEYNSTVKDSPYFLGFILTLAGLIKVFLDIGSFSGSAGASINAPALVGQAGGALFPTIVGLFFRQLLWSHDRFDDRRESVFYELRENLREGAAEYHAQQGALVDLVRDFVASRQKLYSAEEGIHTRYLAYLTETNKALDDFNTRYPSHVATLLDSLKNAAAAISKSTTDFSAVLDSSSKQVAETFSDQAKKFVDTVSAATEPINRAGKELSQSVIDFDSTLDTGGKKIAESLDRFAATVGETPASLKETATSLEAIRVSSKGLEESIQRVTTAASSIQTTIDTLVKGISTDTDALHAEIIRRAKVLSYDMGEVDKAFDELMTIMSQRLKAGDLRLRTDGSQQPR